MSISLGMPYFRKIKGKIWELRVDHKKVFYRVFYVTFIQDKIVLLHGYNKKTNKTPVREIDQAEKNYKEFMKDPDFKKGVELEKRKLEMAIKINQLRKKRKMSQATLAKKVGMKQSAIGRIETGNQNLTLETLHRIADALQCKLEVKLG